MRKRLLVTQLAFYSHFARWFIARAKLEPDPKLRIWFTNRGLNSQRRATVVAERIRLLSH